MSGRADHESMDDVLASIRRIVRAETEFEPEPAADEGGATGQEAAIAISKQGGAEQGQSPAGGVSASPAQPPAGAFQPGPESTAEAGADTPLLLTEDMRADRIPGRGADAGSAAGKVPSPEREILRMLITEILAAELQDGAFRDILRDVIRDELANGPLGRNATQNVRAMIRAEITEAHPEER